MNSRTQINSRWLTRLAEEYPEAANQLDALTQHLLAKQERLAALIRYCAARPELPLMRMYTEYSAALDAVALEPARDAGPEVSDEEAAELDAITRAARTKRLRTRSKAISTAGQLLSSTNESLTLERVAEVAGIGIATLYAHFRSRSQLVTAAYDHLIVTA